MVATYVSHALSKVQLLLCFVYPWKGLFLFEFQITWVLHKLISLMGLKSCDFIDWAAFIIVRL